MDDKAHVGGVFHCKIIGKDGVVKDEWDAPNLVPATGLNHILNVTFAQTAVHSLWYVGAMANYTPIDATNMTNIAANEVAAYSEGTRPLFVPDGATSTKSLSNSASPATFTCNANGTSVYGLFICSSNTKTSSTGTLLAAARFASTKTLDSGDELVAVYTFGAADDGV
jgi:hypothetical protein